jgi:hypothetical protein
MIFFSEDAGKERVQRAVPAQPMTLERVLGDLCSPAILYRRNFLARSGGFDGRYRYSHDRELLLRAWRDQVAHAVLPHDVYRMRIHRRSRTTSGNTPVLLAYLREHIEFADHMLSQAALAPEAHHVLQRWRDEELIKCKIAGLFQPKQVPSGIEGAELPALRFAGATARVVLRRFRRAAADPRNAFAGLLSPDLELDRPRY